MNDSHGHRLRLDGSGPRAAALQRLLPLDCMTHPTAFVLIRSVCVMYAVGQ